MRKSDMAFLAAMISTCQPAVARDAGRLTFPDQAAYGAVVVVAGPDGEGSPAPLGSFEAEVAKRGFPDTLRGAVTVVFVRRPQVPLPPSMQAIEDGDGLPGTVVVRVDDDPGHAPMVDFAGDVTPLTNLAPVVAAYGPLSADGFAVGDPGLETDQANARLWTGSGDLTTTTSIASPERYPTPIGAPLVVTCAVPHAPDVGPCTTAHLLAAGVTAMADGLARPLPANADDVARRKASLVESPSDRARAARAMLALLPLLVGVR